MWSLDQILTLLEIWYLQFALWMFLLGFDVDELLRIALKCYETPWYSSPLEAGVLLFQPVAADAAIRKGM